MTKWLSPVCSAAISRSIAHHGRAPLDNSTVKDRKWERNKIEKERGGHEKWAKNTKETIAVRECVFVPVKLPVQASVSQRSRFCFFFLSLQNCTKENISVHPVEIDVCNGTCINLIMGQDCIKGLTLVQDVRHITLPWGRSFCKLHYWMHFLSKQTPGH